MKKSLIPIIGFIGFLTFLYVKSAYPGPFGSGVSGGVSSWNDLTDIPGGFSDNVDDTGASGSTGVSISTKAVYISDNDNAGSDGGHFFRVYGTTYVYIEQNGSVTIPSSATITGSGGLSVTYGVSMGSGTVNGTAANALDVAGGAEFGTGNVALIGTDGKINGPLSSTIIDDLSGANLTNLTAANISAGALGSSVIASSVAVDAVGIDQLSATGSPSGATFLRGDNAWAAPAGSGDVVLASTQTHTGAKTFNSYTVFGGSVTANLLIGISSNVVITSTGSTPSLNITGNGTYGTTFGSSGAFLLDCTGGGEASGMCAQVYSNAGAQGALGGLLNVKADNTAFNQPLLYLVTDGTSGGATNIRMDGPAPQIEMVENDQASPAGKYEIGTNGDLFYISGRNSADNSFENFVEFARRGLGSSGNYVRLLSTASLRFNDADDSNYVSFKASSTIVSNVNFTWPAADGSAGHVLTTNGSGALSFAAGSADNLGSHVAEQILDMAGFQVIDVASMTFNGNSAPVISSTYTTLGVQLTDTTDYDMVIGESSTTVPNLLATFGVEGATASFTNTGATALDVAGGAQFGTGNVALIGTDGKINGPLSSTIIDDLSGANLTNLTAANISAGSLGSSVMASSVAISGFYSNATIRSNLGLAIGTDVQAWDADLDDLADGSLTGSKVGSGVPATNIASGSLGSSVIASSISVNAVYTGAVLANAVDGTKIAFGSDAQGDVAYYNGTDWARLGAGTNGHFLKTQGAGANPTWAASAGAAELSLTLRAEAAKIGHLTTPARIDGSTNTWGIRYSSSVTESAEWNEIIDDDYGAGSLFLDLYYGMVSDVAASTTVWHCDIMAVTSGDAENINTPGFGSVNSSTSTVPTTAYYLTKQTITLSNTDSLAAGDFVRIRLSRQQGAGADDAPADAFVVRAVLRE